MKNKAKKSNNSLRKKFLLVEHECVSTDELSFGPFDESRFDIDLSEAIADKTIDKITIEEKPTAVFMADNQLSLWRKFIIRLRMTNKIIPLETQSRSVSLTSFKSQSLEPILIKKIDPIQDSYRGELHNLFPKFLKNVEIDIGINRSSNLLSTYLFGIEIFELIKKQLKTFMLLVWIDEINVSTSIEAGVVNQVIDFNLKNEGSSIWTTMFSKNVLPVLANKIFKVDGTISSFQQHNLSKDTICFTIIFTHNVILKKVTREIQPGVRRSSVSKTPMEL